MVTVTEAGGSPDGSGSKGRYRSIPGNNMLAAIDDDAEVDARATYCGRPRRPENILRWRAAVATAARSASASVSLNTIASDVSAAIGNHDPLGLDMAAGNRTSQQHRSGTSSPTRHFAGRLFGGRRWLPTARRKPRCRRRQRHPGRSGSAAGASKSGKGKFGIAVSADVSINDIDADTRPLADGRDR